MNNKLREARNERGMSVSELSRRTGLSRNAIINIENNQSDPLSSTILAICLALNKNPQDIFFNQLVIHE